MSKVTYDRDSLTLTVDDTQVAEALGELKGKTPAVLKVAINRTARQARKDIIADSKARYDLTARGKEKLKQLQMRKKATNAVLLAELRQSDEGLPLDYAYFRHTPTTVFKGRNVRNAPKYVRGRVLKGQAMRKLADGVSEAYGKVSKGFLVEFKSGHIGMVQRDIGSRSQSNITARGYGWRGGSGLRQRIEILSQEEQKVAWKGVITNSGSELLAQWTAGKTLTITRAAAGTGRVSEAALLAQTALVSEKQAASILSNKTTAQGQKLQLQVTPLTAGYALNQLGIWAKLDSGAAKLIALFQTDTDAGVEIPSKTDVPDYVYTFYGLLEFTGSSGTLQVTIDASALVTAESMAAAIKAHDEGENAHAELFAGKVDLDDNSTVAFALGYDSGGVYIVTD